MLEAILGGVMIGIAVSIMLLFNGRVTGISGIISGLLVPKQGDISWRLLFIGGLFSGGLLLNFIYPQAFKIETHVQWYDYIVAGLLVGFGTLMGNGCTSGHGVCGISRFSIRSLLSTVTFISFGILSVLIFKLVRGSL